MIKISSEIFGENVELLQKDDPELDTIVEMVRKYPINVFQCLNKQLNISKLCLNICSIGDIE